jgi:hypothetical protein
MFSRMQSSSVRLRRRSIMLYAASAGALLAVPEIAGCSSGATLRTVAWAGPPPGVEDVRVRALSYAILAPNAHNTQPWLLDLRRPGELDLYVDPDRLLPKTDPWFRQIHISQGTFLELLDIAARELGQEATITYFPLGEYSATELARRPVANVRFAPAETPRKDPLFSQITQRLTNRRDYESERRLSPEQKAALEGAPSAPGARFSVVDDELRRRSVAQLLGDAMGVESAARDRNEETARWFNFSDDDAERKRDGFGLAQGSIGGFSRWWAESFILDRKSAGDPNGAFAKGAIDRARAQARAVSAFGLLTSDANTRLDQVNVGRAYARIALTAQSLGLAMHPMTQITEEYAAMTALRERFLATLRVREGATAQMIVRLGFAPPHEHAPRRDVRDMEIHG